ncbi:MAG: cysteine methyltransferase, partial [Clostridia bacterium]|nr:cysteine methyltransferase [Clostridia bacterium]
MKNKMLCKTQYKSPVGNLIIAANDNEIVGLWIEGQKYFLGKLSEMPPDNNKSEILHSARRWL